MNIALRPSYAAARLPNEVERLKALHSYGVLDTETEPAFDDLTRLASVICETPIAVVNLIDAERQWFKSEVGLGTRELPLNESICAHALLQPGLMEIPDTLEDERFSCNPLVTGAPNLRFYAGALLLTSDGHPLGTLCVLDYKPKQLSSEQKDALATLGRQVMAQLDLRKTLLSLTRAVGYKTQLMAIAGHDLRQPLQIMAMSLAALTAKSSDADKKVLARATRALSSLGSDLDKLARASQVNQGDLVHLESVSIQELLQTVASTWELHAERKGIEIRVFSSSAKIVTNRDLMLTMLGNLVGNAIKYTESGAVLIGCRRSSSSVQLQVWDTGCGIAEASLNSVFEAFVQLDSTAEGLGLGLSIVKQTAGILGHRLGVRSWPGQGTCFSIEASLA